MSFKSVAKFSLLSLALSPNLVSAGSNPTELEQVDKLQIENQEVNSQIENQGPEDVSCSYFCCACHYDDQGRFDQDINTLNDKQIASYQREVESAKNSALSWGICGLVWGILLAAGQTGKVAAVCSKPEMKQALGEDLVNTLVAVSSAIWFPVSATCVACGSCILCEYCNLSEKADRLSNENRGDDGTLRGNKQEISVEEAHVCAVEAAAADVVVDTIKVNAENEDHVAKSHVSHHGESEQHHFKCTCQHVAKIVLVVFSICVGILLLLSAFFKCKSWNESRRRNLDSYFARSTFQSDWAEQLEQESEEDEKEESALMGVQTGHALN